MKFLKSIKKMIKVLRVLDEWDFKIIFLYLAKN